MQQRGIDPAKCFKIRRLLARAFPLLIMPIVALLTVFRSNEDLFNFRHPVSWGRSLLCDGSVIRQADDTHDECEEQANDDLWCRPSASRHRQSRLHPTKWKFTPHPTGSPGSAGS